MKRTGSVTPPQLKNLASMSDEFNLLMSTAFIRGPILLPAINFFILPSLFAEEAISLKKLSPSGFEFGQ